MKYFLLQILFCFIISCKEITTQKPDSTWNLLGGSYFKHGEMMAYDGYWLEGYRDTINNNILILLVDRGNKNYISDSLKIDSLPNGAAFDYGSAELNGQTDRSLVVTYVDSDSNFHATILKAWRANTTTGKFELTSTTGIQVETIR